MDDMQVAATIAAQLLPHIAAEHGLKLSEPKGFHAAHATALVHAWELLAKSPIVGAGIAGQQRPR